MNNHQEQEEEEEKMSSDQPTVTNTENAEQPTMQSEEQEAEDRPMFAVIYKNDDEGTLRNFSVDMTPLVKQMDQEGLSEKERKLVLNGFQAAARIFLDNYDIKMKKAPIDSFSMHLHYQEKIQEALDKEEQRINDESREQG